VQPGQRSVLRVGASDGSDSRTVWDTTDHIEAPNWSPDGRWLVFNSGGKLYRLAADGSGEPAPIDTGAVDRLNNDHVISPDGHTLYVSNNDGHLYAVGFEGGTPRRVTNDQDPSRGFLHFLHGISPDGTTLAYVGLEKNAAGGWVWDLWTIPAAGGRDNRLTQLGCPSDGPEFSPDGQWLYYNSEEEARRPGHSQLFRRHLVTGQREQLTFDDRVNWFPHPSPDGRQVVYLSYPEGTEGHPADKAVNLRILGPSGTFRDLAAFHGGQGTINVNSWAPDSRRLAWVEYPLGAAR